MFGAFRAVLPGLLLLAMPAQAQFLPFVDGPPPPPSARQPVDSAPLADPEDENGGQGTRARPQAGRKPEAPKPAVVVRKFPVNPPLPPSRPWGTADAPPLVEETPTEVAAIPHAAAPEPAPAAPAPTPAAQPRGAAPQAGPRPAPAPVPAPAPAPAPAATPAPAALGAGERSLVVIVRNGLKKPQDLEGRRIALGPVERDSEDLKKMFQLATGINVDPVSMGWTSGLTSLARGELDGVLLGPGPKLSAAEVSGLGLDGYQLLEIPLAGDAGKAPVR